MTHPYHKTSVKMFMFIEIVMTYVTEGTHMPGGERRKPIDIEDRRTKVKVTTSKNRANI
jgi:hypothetical protein